MSYSNLYGQPQGKPYYFTNKLREALIAEIIAINGYEEHIANSNIPEVNKYLPRSIPSVSQMCKELFQNSLKILNCIELRIYSVGLTGRRRLPIFDLRLK